MKPCIRVLVIENVESDFLLLERMLKQEGEEKFCIEWVKNLAEGVQRLAKGEIDIVLSDLNLPDAKEYDCIIQCYRQEPNVPILAVTGSYHEAHGIGAIRAGAQEYILKDRMNGHTLKRTIEYALERFRLYKIIGGLSQFKDATVAAVSHELRAPLSILKGAIDNLKDGVVGSLSNKQREVTETADRNIKRLEKIVDGLLDIARLESGQRVPKLQVLQITSLMTGLVSELQETASKNHRVLKSDLPESLPAVSADPDLLTEVFLNLFNNALCFAKNTIEVKAALSGEKGKGRWVQISVIDDGPGIPKERLQDIFKKFYQLDLAGARKGYKGTGLGLAICKEIIEQHHGRIWAESTPGHGALFHFTLPIS